MKLSNSRQQEEGQQNSNPTQNPVLVQPFDLAVAFENHGAFIGRSIRALVGEGPQVDDLLQDTFVIAITNSSPFKGRSSERTWLYGIARHLCWRYHRSLGRKTSFLENYGGEPQKEVPPMDDKILSKQKSIQIKAAISSLPFKQREVTLLYELEGLDGKEIATLLSIPLGTVWTRLKKAREGLKKKLKGLSGEAELNKKRVSR